MQELILYIQPQLVSNTQTAQDFVRVDLMEAELITLTQVIQDVKEIDKLFTDYSRTFNLPASKTNNKIFKYWFNPDVTGFDNQVMSSAIIELNHLPFKEGKIKLEEVVMKDGAPSIYKVTFFGNTVSLSNLIGNEQLKNLNWLSNFNYIPTNDNVKYGLEQGLDITVDSVLYTDAIIYPLISHSEPYIYNRTGDFDNFGNIAYVTSSVDTTYYNRRGVFPEDLKPAIKATLIIKAIEEQYNIKFKTGEFFDSAAISNMYMWLHREKGKIIDQKTINVTSQSNTCSLGLQGDYTRESNSCNWYARAVGVQNNTLTEFSGGVYKITGQLNADGQSPQWEYRTEITPSNNTIVYTVEIIDLNTNNVLSISKNVTGQQVIYRDLFTDSLYPPLINGAYILNVGQQVQLAVRITSNDALSFDAVNFCKSIWNNFDTGDYDTTSNTIYYSTRYDYSTITLANNTLFIQDQTPKINVLDFLKGLFKMHNLTAFIDDNNEIVVKTLDSFYSAGDTIDISKYVVTDKNTVGATLPFTEIDLQYPEPKTILAQQFLQQNNQRFGELEFISDASKGEKYTIEAPFEKMIYERLNNLSDGTQTAVQYGLFLDDDLKPSVGSPLLFYSVRQYTTNYINFVYTTRPESGTPAAGTRYGLSAYFAPLNTNEVGTTSTAPTYNTNFGSEINEWNLTDYNGINNSLFQLYYQNYITRVFNKKTRLFKYKAILPLSILIKLSLDDKIVVGTREFTINKMTTKLQSGETELELLNEPT